MSTADEVMSTMPANILSDAVFRDVNKRFGWRDDDGHIAKNICAIRAGAEEGYLRTAVEARNTGFNRAGGVLCVATGWIQTVVRCRDDAGIIGMTGTTGRSGFALLRFVIKWCRECRS